MYYFDANDFATRLQTLRKAQGMTQEEMAEALNISLEHFSKMERGKRKPSQASGCGNSADGNCKKPVKTNGIAHQKIRIILDRITKKYADAQKIGMDIETKRRA